jgi:putative oxidoreductase
LIAISESRFQTKEMEMSSMVSSRLAPFSQHAYAMLRIMAGLLFMFHGVQKIFGVLTAHQPPVGSQLWIGGVIELVCGAAIALGLFTRWAAFLASGTMAVAYIQFHWKFRFDDALLPAVNKGELALLYAFVFLFMACKGDGPWSLSLRKVRTGPGK